MSVDPQVERYLEQMAALGAPVIGSVSVEDQRRAMRARRVMEVNDRRIPGPDGLIPLRMYTPAGVRPLPILVYFHGGGWAVGDLDTTDLRCRMLAEWVGCVVVSVDYRLAPEHRFPAAIDDAYAATSWVAENAASLQADASRLAVVGDSAGGNLAAAVTLMARDRGGPGIVYQCLVYPVLDWNPESDSYQRNAEGYGLSRETMIWYWEQYLPDEAERLDPLASPLRAPDLSGLPPALVITAEYDPLRDEGEAYAGRLREAGVPVVCRRYDGMIHGFVGQAAEFDAGKKAIIESVAALREALAPVTVAAHF